MSTPMYPEAASPRWWGRRGGKSTLLRAINRLIEPTAGEVYLDCKPTSEMNFLELRRRVGMVFQLPARNSMNTARHHLRSAALE